MSIVNVKIVLVKKQKQARERPTQGWGSTFIYNRNGRFHTRDGLFVWEEFFFSQILHRNTMTEIAWEVDVQRLGKAMSTVASEKNRELLFTGNVFYKQWHLRVLFH